MSDLTEADKTVLRNLQYDIKNNIQDSSKAAPTKEQREDKDSDEAVKSFLEENSNTGWVFTMWDENEVNPTFNKSFVQPYLKFAESLVRQAPDAVFITHLIVHYTILLPSALYLFYNFTWWHGIAHTIFAAWNAGPFTLMLHNHIHNNGILRKSFPLSVFDRLFPYISGPLCGHTWDSYYYHHVKMHHVEGNGADDLSTTIYYQRDEPTEFLKYLGSFLLITWIQLPIYFFRTKKYGLAAKALISECSSMATIYTLTYLNPRPATFCLLLPWAIMRIGMMVGNWGQHCLVDNVDPMSDFRSSITLIDVSSNRHCFNDGYHTSHHLNPKRHWKKHPEAFLRQKAQYQTEGALTFANVDYIMITMSCLTKNFDKLARHLVPMGEQISMSHEERVEMLRSKTRKFTPEEIKTKFLKGARSGKADCLPIPEVVVEDHDEVKKIPILESRPAAGKVRRSSITQVRTLAKEVMGDSSGILVNPDILSQRI